MFPPEPLKGNGMESKKTTTASRPTEHSQQTVVNHVVIAKPKLKSTAILLAVFFGIFTWLYTYQKDSTKFWLNLILSCVTFGIWGIVAYFWALILSISRPTTFYTKYPNA